MINRAKLRGKKLDEDCKRAYTSSHEYGLDDDRIFCYGLVDYSTDELIEKCKNCKALAYNATPPQEKKDEGEKDRNYEKF